MKIEAVFRLKIKDEEVLLTEEEAKKLYKTLDGFFGHQKKTWLDGSEEVITNFPQNPTPAVTMLYACPPDPELSRFVTTSVSGTSDPLTTVPLNKEDEEEERIYCDRDEKEVSMYTCRLCIARTGEIFHHSTCPDYKKIVKGAKA